MVLNLLNSNYYVPKAVIIHSGHSDFGVMPQHLVKFYTAEMANMVTKLLCRAQPFRHHHIGRFTSLMLPEQYYIGWSTQKVVHRARAHYNGCLARAATLAGHYIISHPELSPQDHPAFLAPGKTMLSRTGNLIFMANVQAAIWKVDPEYHPPLLSQVTTHMRNDTKFQEAWQPSHSVRVVNNKWPAYPRVKPLCMWLAFADQDWCIYCLHYCLVFWALWPLQVAGYLLVWPTWTNMHNAVGVIFQGVVLIVVIQVC